MNLYPNNPSANNDSLYPREERELHNPMNRDLDGGGFDITNIQEINMINDGSIKDVIKINGLPYPPAYPTLPNTRSQTFLFPRLDNILNPDGGGGALSQMFVIYDFANGVNTQLEGVFGNPSINAVQLTLQYNAIQTAGVAGPLGYFSLFLYVNGSSVQSEGQIACGANSSYGAGEAGENSVTTSTFNLVRGVHWSANTDVIVLWGRGTYNLGYYFNYIMKHPEQSVPTVCRAVGFP
jgi:hypothetical protein